MARPSITAGLFAQISEAAPARLVRKLDKTPDRAEAWVWTQGPEGWSVDAAKAVVTLIGNDLSVLSQIHCDCLLSPRCLHILSVVARLEVGSVAEMVHEVPTEEELSTSLTSAQQTTAKSFHALLVELLDAGFQTCGTLAQGRLLRCAHSCRVVRLPRLAGHALRITQSVRALLEHDPDLRTAVLAREVGSALAVSERLAANEAQPDDIGISRRRYETLGGLRLTGLFSEPVLTRGGYAGVVTTLVDSAGRLFTVSDVRPGEPGRVRGVYQGGIEVGGATVSHADLGRSGLFITNATASQGGRLGRGKDVSAVGAPASSWPDSLFESAGGQIRRLLREGRRPEVQRLEGWDLVFFNGVFSGGQLAIEGRQVPVGLPSDSEHLRYRENQRVLAGLTGPVRGIARFVRGRLELLALSAEGEVLALAPTWKGRVNLGLDRLPGAAVPTPLPASVREQRDPAAALRLRMYRVLLGGASAMPASANTTVQREARHLQRLQLGAGAALLVALHRACGRGPAGTHGAASPAQLATVFAAATLYEEILEAELLAAGW